MSDQSDIQAKLDSLIDLVSSREVGQTDEDAIEQAVSSLLSNVPDIKGATPSAAPTNASAQNNQNIVIDQDEYDDDDGDDQQQQAKDTATARKKTESMKIVEPVWTGEKATLKSLKEQEEKIEANKKAGSEYQFDISEEWKDLENIPLGRTGAKIMVTFGDGPQPLPDACATALLATRQCLQTAIKDARALRRKMKIEFEKAKVVVNLHKAKAKERKILGSDASAVGGIDMNLYFHAISGRHSLSYENPAGFDEVQLDKLFPEEMFAYKRWSKLHKAYSESKNDDARSAANSKGSSLDADQNEDEKEEIKKSVTIMKEGVGGHLRDRLVQFDMRTDRMKEQWYMAFAEVRKGSFVTRSGLSSEDREWEKHRKKGGGKGKKRICTWEALPSSHIQFLHWVGFDTRSKLPPPDVATTEALAFLGYDFFGKIIEKAIYIRFLDNREKIKLAKSNGTDNGNDNEGVAILELDNGLQLTKEDIERSLSDSTVVPKPLYNATNSTLDSTEAAQIYFGPGFEERIEMEMEQ